MKYLLFLVPFALFAQPSAHIYTTVAPSGACPTRAIPQIVITTGGIYTCANGTWTTGAGGGTGTVTSVGLVGTAAQLTVTGASPITASGSWTLSIPATFTFPGTVTNNLSIFGATTSAQVASVVSDETGTGLLVFGTSPTIVTPTIVSFVNANHTHTNAAGGGQLNITTASNATGTPGATTFLRGDNTWSTPSGSGTVTVVGAGNLTSTACVTGGGSQAIQTPDANCTIASNGNISTDGTISTGVGGSSAGALDLGAGTAHTAAGVGFQAPTAITTPFMFTLPVQPAAGLLHATNAAPSVLTSSLVVNADITNATIDLTTKVNGTLPVANGGTSLATLTAHALYAGNGTSAPTALAVGATDKPVVGVTGADPAFSKLTLTNPATAATLTIADNKTLTANNSITLAGTDTTTMTFPSTSQTIPGMNQVNTAGSSYTLNLTTNQGAQFLYGPQAPSVSDTDAICAATAGTPACPAGAILVSGTNEASFATNIAMPANGLAANRAMSIYYGYDTGQAAAPVNWTFHLRACPTANFTTGNATACSSGGTLLWTSNAGTIGVSTTANIGSYYFVIQGGGSNTLYVTELSQNLMRPSVATTQATKASFTITSAWTLYMTAASSAATAGNWVQQTQIIPHYIN